MTEPRIIRVFPSLTSATPHDPLAFLGVPPERHLASIPEADEVHVSVTFTWDVPAAERLARAWSVLGLPVKVGGPAMGTRGVEFVPGRYVAPGYTITSRGCPNRCSFCDVPGRDGDLRVIPIRDGWNVLDSNLLACPDDHVQAVFAMLALQPKPAQFTGGLEAARLKDWHADALAAMTPQPEVFFAYDHPGKWGPLVRAVGMLRDRGVSFAGHRVKVYVLIGYGADTLAEAEARCRRVLDLGIWPMAMLYRAPDGRERDGEWRRLARRYANRRILGAITQGNAAHGALL